MGGHGVGVGVGVGCVWWVWVGSGGERYDSYVSTNAALYTGLRILGCGQTLIRLSGFDWVL